MRIFISWSGERSRKVGELLDDWLQCVLQAVVPWMSSKDIDRGSLWFNEITDQLRDTSIGILCLTHENIDKPWILFEAGALAKGLSSSRVCTLLIDLTHYDIKDPLAQFNHTLPTKSGLWNLVGTLNNALGDDKLKEKILQSVFDTYWPQFEEQFKSILDDTPENTIVVKRPNEDILVELLTVSRNLDKRLRNLEMSERDLKQQLRRTEQDNLVEKMHEDGVITDEVFKHLTGKYKTSNKFPKNIIHKYLDQDGNYFNGKILTMETVD